VYDAAHRRLGDDHVIEGDVFGQPLPVTPDLRGQHDTLFDDETSREERFQRREQLVHGQRGEETQTAQVDAKDGNGEIAHESRHRQEGAVSAEDEQKIDLGGQLGLENRRDPRLGAEAGRLLVAEWLEILLPAPCEKPFHDASGLGAVGLRDDANSLHAGSADSAARVMSPSKSAMVRPVRVRWRKNSRLPLGPLRGEGVTPRTCQPWRTQNRATRDMTVLWWLASRTTPPLPTRPFPISN